MVQRRAQILLCKFWYWCRADAISLNFESKELGKTFDEIIFIDKLCIEISNVRPTVSQNITGAAVIPINKKGFTELLDCHVPFAKSNSYKRSLLIERSL